MRVSEIKRRCCVFSEKDFVVIVDLPEGDHEYKFLVDGEWKVNAGDKACSNTMGTENNVLSVKESDFEELENALLKDPNDKRESPYSVSTLGFHKNDGAGRRDSSCLLCLRARLTRGRGVLTESALSKLHFLLTIFH